MTPKNNKLGCHRLTLISRLNWAKVSRNDRSRLESHFFSNDGQNMFAWDRFAGHVKVTSWEHIKDRNGVDSLAIEGNHIVNSFLAI
jgi:hypothetical protein